jgi:hypothetical protein
VRARENYTYGDEKDNPAEETTPLPIPPDSRLPTPDSRHSPPPKPLADNDWLRAVLLDYDTLDFSALNDDEWWADVSQPFVGLFGKPWINAELGLMSAYLREQPDKRPASVRAWKRFVRSWLLRSYKQHQRTQTRGETSR